MRRPLRTAPRRSCTGDSYSAGNRSKTDVEQNVLANGGFLNLQTQAALVLNAGIGQSSSGDNRAIGNTSDSGATVWQDAILSEDPGIDLGVVGQFGKASSSSGGTAAIETGTASAVGNDSETGIGQTEDPSGLVINTQVAAVLNAGIANATTGGNVAIGNEADLNNAFLTQGIEIGQDNGGATTILAGTIVASNNGEASNTSDGLATISTGDAAATGNESGTNLRQEANGAIDGNGLILNTQPALVANVGIASASSGGNRATGNTSTSDAGVEQDVFIASDNGGGTNLLAGIVTASNDGTASNASDGEANITTGRAAAAGNRSQTVLAQNADGEIDGFGVVLNTQPAVVANVGLGVANSGNNVAVGNVSDNLTSLDQAAEIASDNGDRADDVNLLVIGTVTGANGGSAENASDGTADIRTGAAQATGNASATHLTQDAVRPRAGPRPQHAARCRGQRRRRCGQQRRQLRLRQRLDQRGRRRPGRRHPVQQHRQCRHVRGRSADRGQPGHGGQRVRRHRGHQDRSAPRRRATCRARSSARAPTTRSPGSGRASAPRSAVCSTRVSASPTAAATWRSATSRSTTPSSSRTRRSRRTTPTTSSST